MGKRELLLIIAFAVVGTVVYQITAPPPGPNERSLSISRILDAIRREVRGNRARAEATTTTSHAIDASTSEMFMRGLGDVQIAGEDRADIETTVRVVSNGYDEAEAKKLAGESVLLVDRAAGTVSFRMSYPSGGRQTATIVMKVPSRLRVRAEGTSRLGIGSVAAVELPGARNETTIRQVAGRVVVTHRAGRLTIEDVASLKLSARGDEVTLKRVRGDATISLLNAELTASALGGPVDIDAQSSEVTFEDGPGTRGPIRMNASAGAIVVKGLRTDTRIDGRNTPIEVEMAAAAPVAIYNEGDELIELTPPPSGFRLDALAIDGRITPEAELRRLGIAIEAAADHREQRAVGEVKGGGPSVTLRANRGSISIGGRGAPKDEKVER
jgi:hypothetical protein